MSLDAQEIERQAKSLLAQGRLGDAETVLRAALAGGTGPVALWRLLAHSLRPRGFIEETRRIQEMIVEALPGDLPARFDLAETALLQGDFERGWREYRWRYSLEHTTRIDRKVQRVRWDGRPIPGKTLLIHDEQGYGDSLQFIRMVPWAKQKSGATVILEVNPDLLPFARRMPGHDLVVVRGELPPAFDLHCEMMSLPMVMGLKLSDLPGQMPYLSADPDRVKLWRDKLKTLPRPLVALVWAGRPTHHNDANRSVKLADLAPLADVPEVTFIAVQKGPKAAEALDPPGGLKIVSLSDEIADFEDTAAILSVADLLISVDSSPVHLAGALGRPVWVLLPFIPDWRWLMGREDTPWYPATRLFRQSAPGDWPGVVQRVAEALRSWQPAKAP